MNDFLIGIIVLVLGILLSWIGYSILKIKPEKKKKRQKQQEKEEPKKDWEKVAGHFERKTAALEREIKEHEKKIEKLEQVVADDKVEQEKIMEQSRKEHLWVEKEQEMLQKKSKEYQKMKEELVQLQEDYTKEHSLSLKLTYDLKDLKRNYDETDDQRRAFEIECRQLKEKNSAQRQEISQLTREVLELKKKKEAEAWIAKGDYEMMEKQYKSMKRELERLKEEQEPKKE